MTALSYANLKSRTFNYVKLYRGLSYWNIPRYEKYSISSKSRTKCYRFFKFLKLTYNSVTISDFFPKSFCPKNNSSFFILYKYFKPSANFPIFDCMNVKESRIKHSYLDDIFEILSVFIIIFYSSPTMSLDMEKIFKKNNF